MKSIMLSFFLLLRCYKPLVSFFIGSGVVCVCVMLHMVAVTVSHITVVEINLTCNNFQIMLQL